MGLSSAHAALHVMKIFRLKVVVIAQLPKPGAPVEAKVGIEARLAVEIQFHGGVSLPDVIGILRIAHPQVIRIDVGPFYVIRDRESMPRVELLRDFKRHADEFVAPDHVGVAIQYRHAEPVEYAQRARGCLGVSPDEIAVPSQCHGVAKGERRLQRVGHPERDVGTVIQLSQQPSQSVEKSLKALAHIAKIPQ